MGLSRNSYNCEAQSHSCFVPTSGRHANWAYHPRVPDHHLAWTLLSRATDSALHAIFHHGVSIVHVCTHSVPVCTQCSTQQQRAGVDVVH